MKDFKKLALAAAISAAPVSALAMESMDDAALSAVTGQDGISIELGNDISTDLIIHDTDGFGTFTDSGAIVIQGFAITRANTADTITIDIDAGTNAGATPTLNVAVTTPANMTVNLGTVAVADSNRGTSWGYTGAVNVMTLGSLTLGSTSLNIQLGNEPQGNMIAANTVISGGISLTNFAISDAGGLVSGGDIHMANLSIINDGGTDLNVVAGVDVAADALVVDLTQFGDATNGVDIRITDLRLGSSGAGSIVGDIELNNLDLTGTIRISGK